MPGRATDAFTALPRFDPMTTRDALCRQARRGVASAGLQLPAGAVPPLLDYQALLERWNAAYNLTAVRRSAEWSPVACSIRWRSCRTCKAPPCRPGYRSRSARRRAGDRRARARDPVGGFQRQVVRFLREAIRALETGRRARANSARISKTSRRYELRPPARAFASLADMLGWRRPSAGAGRHLAGDEGKRPDDELRHPPRFRGVRGRESSWRCRGCRPSGICWCSAALDPGA